MRRAAAYLAHVATSDSAGYVAIVDDAKQSDRLDKMLYGITQLFFDGNPNLYRSPEMVQTWRDRRQLRNLRRRHHPRRRTTVTEPTTPEAPPESGVPNVTLAAESEQISITESAPDNTPDEQQDDHLEPRKYRNRAQAAEAARDEIAAERDRLAERLTAMQRSEAERLAGQRLGKGVDLWAGGVELGSLLDDSGALSAERVNQAVAMCLRNTHTGGCMPRRPHPRLQATARFRATTPAIPSRTLFALAAGRVDGARPVRADG